MAEHLNETQTLLLRLLSAALFRAEAPEIPASLLPALTAEARSQAVEAVALSPLPDSRDVCLRAAARYFRIEAAHTELHRVLTAADVPYAVLKGCASASRYPRPELRAMGDVDFLVRKEDVPRASAALTAAGFEDTGTEFFCEHHFLRGGVTFELHWEPNGIPDGEAGTVLRRYCDGILADAVTVSVPTGEYRSPSDFHHGLVLLLHAAHHMLETGIGLRQLCDWAVFVSGIPAERFLPLFGRPLAEAGLWRFAQILTVLSTEYLGLPPQPWVQEQTDPVQTERLMLDLFAAGNFGKKDASRRDEGKLITSRSTGGVQGGAGRQLFRSLFDAVRARWPASRKHPILLPFGAVWFGMKYLLQMLAGKRRRVGADTLRNARQRRQLYRDLKLYEP